MGWSLVEEMQAAPEASRLADIDVAQPWLCAYEIALAELWQSWGLRPHAVVGHSMGEVAAAHIAGALTLDDAMRVICRRSALLRRVSGQGAMAVVELSAEEASAAMAGYADRVSVAVSNSRRSTVISGDPVALDHILDALERRDVFCRRVKVDVASHSPQMDPLGPDLLDALAGLSPGAVAVPLYSTVTTTRSPGRDLDPTYWTRNLRQPVRFAETVHSLLDDGHVTFIEMSPHPLLVGAIDEAARDAGVQRVLAVGSARRDESERENLLDALSRLYVRGHDVHWPGLFDGRSPQLVSLPPYRWRREHFWYDAPATAGPVEGDAIPGPPIASAVDPGTTLWSFGLSRRRWPDSVRSPGARPRRGPGRLLHCRHAGGRTGARRRRLAR